MIIYMKKNSNVFLYVIGILLLAVAGVLVWAMLNLQWLEDWWRGKDYQPVGEMLKIRRVSVSSINTKVGGE